MFVCGWTQGGPLHTASIELTVEVVEGCVAAAVPPVLQPNFPAALASSTAQGLLDSGELQSDPALLPLLLPLLQACVASLSHR